MYYSTAGLPQPKPRPKLLKLLKPWLGIKSFKILGWDLKVLKVLKAWAVV